MERAMRAPVVTFKRARELRRIMTLPEVLLWQALRGGRLGGVGFRRQPPIGPYFFGFFCPSWHLAVEVDGLAHDNAAQVQHDARRQTWLAEQGINVLRVTAADVLRNLEGVLLTIGEAAAASGSLHAPAPSGSLRSPPP